MATANKLTYLNDTKTLIRDNINALGGDLTEEDTFRSYANMLDEIWEEQDHVTETGTDITLNGTKKGKAKVDLKGNTSQETTTGKNLINITLANGTYYNELTFTKISEGTYRINGSTGGSARSLILVNSAYNPTIEAGQNYTLSVEKVSGTFNGNFPISIYNSDDTIRYNYFAVNESHLVDTQNVIQNNGIHQISFYIPANTTTDFTFKLQLEKGSTKTDFEPYTGGIASPNPSYPQTIHNVNGDNEIVVTGKNILNAPSSLSVTGNYQIYVDIPANTDFTIKADGITLGGENGSLIQFRDKDNNSISSNLFSGSNLSYLRNINKDIASIMIYSQDNYAHSQGVSTTYTKLMITTSTDTTYTPYQSTSYPINLPIENIYEGSQDFSGTWGNSNTWETDSNTYNGLVVKKKKAAWNGINKNIAVESGKTYTFSLYAKSDSPRVAYLYLTGGTATAGAIPYSQEITTTTDWQRYSITFSVSTSGTVRARLENKTDSDTNYTYICGYQLEVGDEANAYTPYGTTPIELCKIGTYQDKFIMNSGENLWDEEMEAGGYDLSTGEKNNSSNYRCVNYISITPNTAIKLLKPTGIYTRILFYDENKDFISAPDVIYTNQLYSAFTSPSNAYYMTFYITNTYGATYKNDIMIYYGTTNIPYEPYGNGDWYLKKHIGKVVLDENSNFNSVDNLGSGTYRFTNNSLLDGINSIPYSYGLEVGYSNYFHYLMQYSGSLSDQRVYTADKGLIIITSVASTSNELSTWLGTHNTIVYYVLATPTYTKIEGTLKDELDEVWRAYSYKGQTNIIQINNDLPFELDVTALESEGE